MLQQLWRDEGGAVLSAELVMIGSICVIGLTVGLAALRDGVVSELADLGQAIGSLNQSYSFGGAIGHHAIQPGSLFTDNLDQCDDTCEDPDGMNARCVELCAVPAEHEGDFTGANP